jgi:hypothetical protein
MLSDKVTFTIDEWVNTPEKYYNYAERFLAEVDPLIDELMAKCAEIGIPYAMKFVPVNADDGYTMSTRFNMGGVEIANPELMCIEGMEDFEPQFVLHVAKVLAGYKSKLQKVRENEQ